MGSYVCYLRNDFQMWNGIKNMHFKRQSLVKSISERNDSNTAEKIILGFYTSRASSSVQRSDKTALTARFHGKSGWWTRAGCWPSAIVAICFPWPLGITFPHTGLASAGQQPLQFQEGHGLHRKLYIQTGSDGASWCQGGIGIIIHSAQ